ncbi:MAG: hypothetical protein II779_10205, partial [Clostridia bacterium]|nr:hypothetical protein [Clostridia bacterium]
MGGGIRFSGKGSRDEGQSDAALLVRPELGEHVAEDKFTEQSQFFHIRVLLMEFWGIAAEIPNGGNSFGIL